jgi:hypothetical protein
MDPAEIRRFYAFYDIEAQKKRNPVRRRPPHLPAQSALSSAFMAKTHLKNLGFGLGHDLTITAVQTQI